MNLKEKVKELKKKNKAKQAKGLDALIQLVDLIRDERGDLKELLEKDNPKQIIEAISKLENNFKDLKHPDFNKLIDTIEKIKIAPQVSVNVQYLEKVEKLLKELKEQQQTEQPFDIKGLIRLLKKPENAIAVRLTKKDQDEFYNAILTVVGGGGGGGAAAAVQNKAIQLQSDSGDPNVEYLGIANVGVLTSAAAWQIMRIDNNVGIIITWAGGNSRFDNIYDDREALDYS